MEEQPKVETPTVDLVLKPRESFDYEQASTTLGPTAVLDIMQNTPEYNNDFDFVEARKKYGDNHLFSLLSSAAHEKQKKIAKAKYKDTNDFEKGLQVTGLNLRVVAEDVLNALHFEDDETYNKNVAGLRKTIKGIDMAKESDDFLSMFNGGRFAGELLALPVSVSSRVGIFAIGSILGYADSRGIGGNDKLESAAWGAGSGAAGVAISTVIKSLRGGAAPKVQDYYQKQFNISDDKLEELVTARYEIMEPSGDPIADRIVAMMEHAGQKGEVYKQLFSRIHPTHSGMVDLPKQERLKALQDLTKNSMSIKTFGRALKKSEKIVHDNYGAVARAIGNKYPGGTASRAIYLPEAVEDMASDRKLLHDALQLPYAVQDLVDSMPVVNRLVRKSESQEEHKWKLVAKEMTEQLDSMIYRKDFNKWKEVNADYKRAAHIMDGTVGKTVEATLRKDITVPRALEILRLDRDSGPNTYKYIRTLIGGPKTAQFELAALRDILDGHIDDLSWNTFHQMVKTKGFVTEESNRVAGLLDTLRHNFRTDDVAGVVFKSHNLGSNISTTAKGKAEMSMMSAIFRSLKPYVPLSANAKELRRQDSLFKILKNPQKVKKFQQQLNEMDEGMKTKIIRNLTL